jgi:hypothetical protein
MSYMYILNEKEEAVQVNNPEVFANWMTQNSEKIVAGDTIVGDTRILSGFTGIGLQEQLFLTTLVERDGRVHGIVFSKNMAELREAHARIVKEIEHVHMVAQSAGRN